MKRILLSLVLIGGISTAAYMGATGAFFSDTETSIANTFEAGSLDLKVDSTAHYNGMVCYDVSENETPNYVWVDEVTLDTDPETAENSTWFELLGTACTGTWTETDLDETNQFFLFDDIKPGDFGENTISLHVYDNDAWGRMRILNVQDLDNSCTEPELEADPDNPGEYIQRASDDPLYDQFEGDNIRQPEFEPIVIEEGTLDAEGETHEFTEALAGVYAALGCTEPTGDTGYEACHGFAEDGRMVASTTYYLAVAWNAPDDGGNELQTDSLVADVAFDVEQHRNNTDPFAE